MLRSIAYLVAALSIATFLAVPTPQHFDAHAQSAKKDDYDRLDGRGPSRTKVDVIEWEGNLEIHVYPEGSLRGLAMRIEENAKQKKIMVIGYRFSTNPSKQLVRRAILSVPLKPGFKAYQDKTVSGYDKVILTNNHLASSERIEKFSLEPGPKHSYPEGHPKRIAAEEKAEAERKKRYRITPARSQASSPSHQRSAPSARRQHSNSDPASSSEPKKQPESAQDENGTIQPFNF